MLRLPEVVDFGLLSASNKTVSKKLSIRNVGALNAHYSISYKGDAAITFFPSKDVIPPNSEIQVRADLFTNKPGKIEEKVL